MKLTNKAAQAFANLRASPDFAVILEWISDHRTQFRDECCTLPPEKVQRSQGKAEVVDDILVAVREAPQVLEKFKSQQ